MSILIFSDLHASKKACQELEKILCYHDSAICCGDIVGFGREPEYCIDFITANGIYTVKGNHEAMVLGESPIVKNRIIQKSIEWTKRKIKRKHLDILKRLPEYIEVDNFYITHTFMGRYIYGLHDLTGEIKKSIDIIDKPIIIIGHTHTQYCLDYKKKIIVNPSSITKGRKGEPRGYAIYNKSRFEFISILKEVV
jgi:putative phosphoesterase